MEGLSAPQTWTSSCSLFFPFVCRKTNPLTRTGELCPSPTGTRQSTFNSPFHGLTISVLVPSRLGPSHCGQSAANETAADTRVNRREAIKRMVRPLTKVRRSLGAMKYGMSAANDSHSNLHRHFLLRRKPEDSVLSPQHRCAAPRRS